jgi:hypothetical protein
MGFTFPSGRSWMMYKNRGNCSVGLRTCCADRKKTYRLQAKIPSTKLILIGFLLVTMKVLNSYEQRHNAAQSPKRVQ